jgi:hypothetical protein
MEINTNTLPQLIGSINKEASLTIANAANYDVFYNQLVQHIGYLIDKHFEQLIFLLYRIDVPEDAIKQLLQLHAIDEAPQLIATAIVQRQYDKLLQIHAVTNYSGKSEEEKW